MNRYLRDHLGNALACAPRSCPPGVAAGSLDPCNPSQLAAYRELRAQQIAQQIPMVRAGYWDESTLTAAQKIEALQGEAPMFGLDTGAAGVAAAAQATIVVTPQRRNIPTRITLSQNVANAFVIDRLVVGAENLLSTAASISAATFVQDSTAPNFRSPVMEVGMDFSISVTNVTGAVQRFTATVHGRFLPSGWGYPGAFN